MKSVLTALTLSALLAGAALAHNGVKDPDVIARMEGMSALGKAVKTLASMARGKAPFDPEAAAAARDRLLARAAAIPEVFEAPASDPKSEALPDIWQDWDSFTAEAEALEQAVAALETSSLTDLKTGIPQIGQACSSCHEGYRIDK